MFEIDPDGRINSEKDVFKKRHSCIGLITSQYMEISTKMKIKLDFFREIINYFSLPNTGSMVLHEGVPHLVSTAARLFGRQPDVILGNPRTLLFLLQKILHNKKPGIQPGLEKKWWFFKL